MTVTGGSFRSPSRGERNDTDAAKFSMDYHARIALDYRDHSHLVTLFVARGGLRRGIGGGPVTTPDLTSSNAWPARSCQALPRNCSGSI